MTKLKFQDFYEVITKDKPKYLYKVVRKIDRSSYAINKNSSYFLKYEKGKIVTAVWRSFGIFCFRTKNYAEDFIDVNSDFFRNKFLIIKVKPLGEIRKPNYIFSSYYFEAYDSLKYSYKTMNYSKNIYIPYGTICCESVEVLT